MPYPGFKPLEKHQWDAMLAFYRVHPGEFSHCATACGVEVRTATRAWKVGGWKYKWCTDECGKPPIREYLSALADQETRDKRLIEETLKHEYARKAEEARQLEEEANRINVSTLRLARNDIMAGLGHLARLNEGIGALAKRVGEQLARGTDEKGKPLTIDIAETMMVLQRYASSVARLVDATNTLVSIDRVKQGLPTAIDRLEIANVSVEDAEAQVEMAREMMQRAKSIGLLTAGVDSH